MVNKYWNLEVYSYEIGPTLPPISYPCYAVPDDRI